MFNLPLKVFPFFFVNTIYFMFFFKYIYSPQKENLFFFYWNQSTYNFSLLGSIVFTTTIIICSLSIFFFKNSLNRGMGVLNFSVICVFCFFFLRTNNLIFFFLNYEFVLLPSVFLVYFSSPNRRAKVVSFYFLVWTQFGSFLVFCGVLGIYVKYNVCSFQEKTYLDLLNKGNFYFFLIFIGFSIKIPVWPFHFWLTKTHVEASTGFSVFLSGVLIKLALYGLYKFNFLEKSYFYLMFFPIFYGIFEISFKLWQQVDFKKIIAYLTVQEMGVILFFAFFKNKVNVDILAVFIIFHSVISLFFFSINDSIYKRYLTRNTKQVVGLKKNFPWLFLFVMVIFVLFSGFPLTVKFFLELLILIKLFNFNFLVLSLFLLFVQYITISFFFKTIVFFSFGDTFFFLKKKDLNFYEFLLFLITSLVIITIPFF